MKRIAIILITILTAVAANAQGIKAGPWTGDVSENSVTILWTSELPGKAWVELPDSTRIYETFAGRRIFRRLHSITVSGLLRGSVLRYRICGENIKDDSNARDPKFGATYEGSWRAVRTLDSKTGTCRFSVINDTHMRRDKYSVLASQIDSAATDFIFLNGDIVSAGNYVTDSLVRYAIEPLGPLAGGLPLFFARGNHEGRGNNTWLVADVFPHANPAPFYYTFRQGPVAFIVFDAGETHERRSRAYCGADVFEDYLNEQIEWAKKAMREPAFRSAPAKICIIHVPMIDHEDKSDYLLQRWLNVHMVPMLNKAGINLMIGADLHEFMMCESGSMGNDFPILVNDECRLLNFSYTRGGTMDVSIFNPSGENEFERSFKVK